MAKCQFCDKGVTFGIKVSHSHRRSNRTWKPNVKRVKAIVDGSPRHVYVCTRCLRSGKVTRCLSGSERSVARRASAVRYTLVVLTTYRFLLESNAGQTIVCPAVLSP